jgi:hypothetical protein
MGCCFSKPDSSKSITEPNLTSLNDADVIRNTNEGRNGNCKLVFI